MSQQTSSFQEVLRKTAPESSVGFSEEEQAILFATQWTLIRWRFQKHKLAVVSLFVVVALYVMAIFCEFLAPYELSHRFE